MIETREIGEAELPAALKLLEAAYCRQRLATPLLPPTLLCSRELAAEVLGASLAKGAAGAFTGRELVGFMGVSALFRFKGLNAALIGEFAHAADPLQRAGLHGVLYQTLGATPALQGCRLHIIAHLSADTALTSELYRLGFGAFLAEEVRDLSPVSEETEPASPEPLADLSILEDLEAEHRRYYSSPPIYLWKDHAIESVRRTHLEWKESGTAVFAHIVDGKPRGYFAVAACQGLEEGRMLRNTNSAQVVSAYLSPEVRGKGIGRSLLNRCIAWAAERGFQRLMVEHETANLLGSAFWGRHFMPYLYFSLRCVEGAPGSDVERT